MTENQKRLLICMFLKSCGSKWDPEETCEDIRTCIASLLTGETSEDIDCLINGCGGPAGGVVPGCCCTATSNEEREEGAPDYINKCNNEDIICDQDHDGDVDCQDMQLFIDHSKSCNGGELDDDETIWLACHFMHECKGEDNFKLCSDFVECAFTRINIAAEDDLLDFLDTVLSLLGCAIDEGCFDDGGGNSGGSANKIHGPVDEGSCGSSGTSADGKKVVSDYKTPEPVSAYYGDKQESVTDLVVPLTGRDFAFTRQYTSDPDFDGFGPVGEHWTASAFRTVSFGATPGAAGCCSRCFSGSAAGTMCTFDCASCTPSGWPTTIKLLGPTAQYLQKTSLSIGIEDVPVWRLIEPGQWEIDFYREKDTGESMLDDPTNRIGLIAETRDSYGNKQVYNYHTYGSIAKLQSIDCIDSADHTEAVILFFWDMSADNSGRLQNITVLRYNGAAPVVTNRVSYLYADSSAPESLGYTGDLIQVTNDERVDPAPGSSSTAPVWHTRITQYRYHHAWGDPDDSDGYTEAGNVHQLKMVINPEQIEFYAQKRAEDDGGIHEVGDYAAELLALDDDEPLSIDLGPDPVLLVSLASKVIAEYEQDGMGGQGRVKTQYVQSSCGCVGDNSQGLKITYDYLPWYGDGGSTMLMKEFVRDDVDPDDWESTPFRTTYLDCELKGPTPADPDADSRAPYLVNEAITDGTRLWVTHYEYDPAGPVETQKCTPSAIDHYTPAAVDGMHAGYYTVPDYGADASVGLIYEYSYTSEESSSAGENNHLSTVAVREGTGGTLYYISRTTYPDPLMLGGDERTWLPIRFERFRTLDEADSPSTSGTNSDDIETTEFTYGFRGGTPAGDDLAWVQTEVEAETTDENGPGGTYSTYEMFDAFGNNFWSAAADGALTQRIYDTGAGMGEVSDTGHVLQVIRNAAHDTGSLPNTFFSLDTSGFGRDADGGSLVTEYVLDVMGRVQERITPGGVSSYTRREMRTCPDRPNLKYYAEVNLPHQLADTSFDGPLQLTYINAAGKTIAAYGYAADSLTIPGSTTGYTTRVGDYEYTTQLSRVVTEHHLTGTVSSTTSYETQSGASYQTRYFYDREGRLDFTINPNDTVTRNTYDELGRVIQVEVGVATGGPPVDTPTNMSVVSQTIYDAASGSPTTQGVGNGNVTMTRQRMTDGGSPTYRDTKYAYDFRDRLILVEPPELPNSYRIYDNLDRVTEQALFKDTPSTSDDLTGADSDRIQYGKTLYSQRGLVYRQLVAINPALATSGTPRTYLESHKWYDETGRAVETWGPNAPATKTTYDGLGRPAIVYLTDRHDDDMDVDDGLDFTDAHTAATHEADVSGDVVIEQTKYNYIEDEGLLERVDTWRRCHRGINLGGALITDSDDGPLDALDPEQSIITYAATYYDDADRVIYSANFGTNSSSGFVGGSGVSAPTIDQDNPPPVGALATQTLYNKRGLVDQTMDMLGRITKFQYDDLNRRIAVIEGWDGTASVVWSGAGGRWEFSGSGAFDDAYPDLDRITSFVYDGVGHVIKQVAHFPDSSDDEAVQETEYVYGVVKGGSAGQSDVESNDLLLEIHYPDESTGLAGTGGSYTVAYAYNRQGELKYMLDQNGSTHEYSRDDAGRVTADVGTSAGGGSPIDTAIRAIGTSYDDAGRVQFVRSYTDSGMTTVANGVEFTYTPLWQVQDIYQAVSGDVSHSSPKVTYAYDTVAIPSSPVSDAVNYSRVSSLTYPDANAAPYTYGSSANDSDDRISRMTTIAISGQAVNYDFIGMSMAAIVDYATPDVQLDRFRGHLGGSDSTPTLKYPGFDRYGRVQRQLWVDGGFANKNGSYATIPPVAEIAYGYDDVSNRTSVKNENPALANYAVRDAHYDYDNLNRLVNADRGQSGMSFTYAASSNNYTASQAWTLDTLGNWKELVSDKNATGAIKDTVLTVADNVEVRSHDLANQLNKQDLNNASLWGLDYTSGGMDDPYDDAGNLRIQKVGTEASPVKLTYTHDLWNRLVKTEYGANTRAVYKYNGMHQRIIKQADTNANNSLDQERRMYYSANWQLLEEYVDDDSPFSADIDRRMFYVWGPRYIDDIVMRRLDGNADGDFSDAGDKTYYHCTDAQFSTLAVLDTNARVLERVSYNEYGRGRLCDNADIDGAGAVNSTDVSYVSGHHGSDPAPGDLDRDGDVDASDDTLASAANPTSYRFGIISDPTDNVIGWDGYVFDDEMAEGGMYTVRFRHYRPEIGRWVERDLAEYVDGMNLFEYATSLPTTGNDPTGLQFMQLPPSTRYLKIRESVLQKRCCPDGTSKRLRLVYDFDTSPDPYAPADTRKVETFDQMVADMEKAMAEHACGPCISELIISGHSGIPGSACFGTYMDVETIHRIRTRKFLQPYQRDLEEKWSRVRTMLCDGASITIVECSLGDKWACEFFQLMDGANKNLSIRYFNGKVWWSPLGLMNLNSCDQVIIRSSSYVPPSAFIGQCCVPSGDAVPIK